jgi:4-carboxymuconolactone decarboxylase
MEQQRYQKGEAVLGRITKADGRAVIEGLRAISPDLGRFIVEFAYGDVLSRTDLDLKTRELTTIAMLGALGGCEPQLRVHLQGSLNVGCTRTEIVETLLQLAVYAGFPRAINAIQCAQAVFSEQV